MQSNLAQHDPAYPKADTLLQLVDTGQPVYGMACIGPGKDAAGSRRIVVALDRPDNRPLWIGGWRGPNTFAQALRTLRALRQGEQMVAKLRVYTISDQDDTGP